MELDVRFFALYRERAGRSQGPGGEGLPTWVLAFPFLVMVGGPFYFWLVRPATKLLRRGRGPTK